MSPKRMGRPPKPAAPGQMAPLSIRITAALKTKVQAAAEANGRSFGAEVESQLDRGFVDRRHAHEWGAGRAGGCRDLDMQAFGPVAPCSRSMTTQPTHAPRDGSHGDRRGIKAR